MHEEMVCLMMRAHAAGGNVAAVIQQFEQLRRIMHEEINARPSTATRELFEILTRERRPAKKALVNS
jgi:DNA-binding SARP family transcriptional activator